MTSGLFKKLLAIFKDYLGQCRKTVFQDVVVILLLSYFYSEMQAEERGVGAVCGGVWFLLYRKKVVN